MSPTPPQTPPTRLTGWGRTGGVVAHEIVSEHLEAATRDVVLTRGLGRSYGDASLPPLPGTRVASSRLADRLLSFDPTTGRVRAEAGVSLTGLHEAVLPRGWFSPVTPGTQFVTLGGMAAADVHGKDHHGSGTFGRHVRRLRLRVADGRVVDCSPEIEPRLFAATIGGVGLTGHILEVEFDLLRVPSPWIWQRVEPSAHLEDLLNGLREDSTRWPYTVAWMDSFARGRAFGRGVRILGRWAEPGETSRPFVARTGGLTVPCDAPSWLLNALTGRAFNALYFLRQRAREGVVHPFSFFYPLDVVRDWNRLYGRAGFIQYQCVVPHGDGLGPIRRVLQVAADDDATSLLTVIKDFGAEGDGLLSFPRPGFTLTLDLPFRGAPTQILVDRLNAVVLEVGGRIYLAKDALTRPEHFREMEPRLADWQAVRREWDPAGRLRSALSVRLLGDAA